MKNEYKFEVLPVEELETDPNQPRKRGSDTDLPRLVASIQKYGVETPLSVVQTDDRIRIIDGHRRYAAARQVGLSHVPCRIYASMSRGELESRRFEIQNNRRPWRPLERAGIINQIKNFFRFTSNKELAAHLYVSESLAANSLQLLGEKVEYLEMMKEHGLSESYQMEFIRLKPKLRRIKEFEIDEIIEIVFKKTEQKTIKTSRDYRRLGSLFKRATANEDALHWFLSNSDATVDELWLRSSRSGVSLFAEELSKAVAERLQLGGSFDQRELAALDQLIELVEKVPRDK